MNSTEYIKTVIARESKDNKSIIRRLKSYRAVRLLHACMGINTESGELTDILKKYVFYGKEIDIPNIIEEIGDLLWYISLVAYEFNISFEELMDINNAKLETRYGPAFSEEKAINRNLDKERKILES
jgi:NTP pyrophosphatase (non-canonical NTP hydrolase)